MNHLLKIAKRKLWIKAIGESVQWLFLILMGLAFSWGIAARFVTIPYLFEKISWSWGFFIISWLIYLVGTKRPTNEQAAHLFDQLFLGDYVTTALEFKEDQSAVAVIQRKEAIEKMNNHLPELKGKKMIRWHSTILSSATIMMVFLGLSFLYPTDALQNAKMLEKDLQIAEKAKDEVNEIEKDEELPKEAKEELEKLQKEIEKLRTSEEIKERLLKSEEEINQLRKEVSFNQQKVNEFISSLENFGSEKLKKAIEEGNNEEAVKELQKMMDDLMKSEEGEQLLESLAQNLGADMNSSQLSQALSEQLQELMNNVSNLENLQTALQQAASNLQGEMMAAGLTNTGSLSFASGGTNAGGGGGSSSGSGGGSPDSSGNSSSSNGESSGNSDGNGNGSNSGSGNGSGSGSGSGTGTGNGTGSGAGMGEGSRQLLTVPQNLDGETEPLQPTAPNGDGPSTYQIMGNSPIISGNSQDYEAILGQYEAAYRNSLDRQDLPDYLEVMIQQYFTDLQQGQGE
ncbi:hypothetical protein RZN22_15750 [Bacillaceae bacterium S4-13-58]